MSYGRLEDSDAASVVIPHYRGLPIFDCVSGFGVGASRPREYHPSEFAKTLFRPARIVDHHKAAFPFVWNIVGRGKIR
jgi:hypothetical protein